jgi:hypothetical protein
VQQQNRYKTILVIVVGFIVLGLVFHLPHLEKIALGIGIASVLSSRIAQGIEWLWLKLAMALGWLNSRILLSVVYFVFLLPIAWISKLFTKDPLVLKGRATSTLFITRNHLYKKEDLENIW